MKDGEDGWKGGEFQHRSKYLVLNQAEILELKIKGYEMKKSLDRFYMILQSRGKDQEVKIGQ